MFALAQVFGDHVVHKGAVDGLLLCAVCCSMLKGWIVKSFMTETLTMITLASRYIEMQSYSSICMLGNAFSTAPSVVSHSTHRELL